MIQIPNIAKMAIFHKTYKNSPAFGDNTLKTPSVTRLVALVCSVRHLIKYFSTK